MMAAEELADLIRQCHGDLTSNITKDLVEVPSNIMLLLDRFEHLTGGCNEHNQLCMFWEWTQFNLSFG